MNYNPPPNTSHQIHENYEVNEDLCNFQEALNLCIESGLNDQRIDSEYPKHFEEAKEDKTTAD